MIIYAKAATIKAAMLAQAQYDARHYLTGLHFIGNQVQSSDGHRALRITEDLINAPKSGIILKLSPVPTGRDIVTAAIDVDAGIVYWLPFHYDKPEDLDDVTPKSCRVAVGTVDVVDANYPDFSRIFVTPDENRPGVKHIGFNVEYFATVTRICKALKMKSSIVKIALQNETSPAFITIKSTNGTAEYCVMPARV